MIHNDVLAQLQFLLKTSAPPLVDVSEHPAELPQWVPGQKLSATVLASLPNGRFQVLVSDTVLDMNLPRNTQPNDMIELTFIGNQPRLTFVLTQDLEGAAANRPQVTLSDTARFLGGLLDRLATLQEDQASSLAASAPLLPKGLPGDTGELAKTLQNALSKSGLFYESHQAQWVAGQRSLTDLLQEPQGRLSEVQAGAVRQEGAMSARGEVTQASDAGRLATVIAAPAGGDDKVNPQTYPLVRQQLDTLDSRQMVWQGQVWPEQAMRWEIEEREAPEGAQEDEPRWQTRLHLVMPNLGDVRASLSLSPKGLDLRLRAADPEAESRMRDAQSELALSLERAGLKLSGFVIHAADGPA